MAPALSLPPREPCERDAVSDAEQSLRRRALASVDNLSTPMEEDDMGLQSQPSLAKDSQEMDQILVDLGSSDLAQVDLLQAIKTLESGGDGLSTGDADAIFPLSGFDLAEVADSEGDTSEDKIRLLQSRLERRCAFLQRRLRILQARSIGKRVAEEAAQTFDKCTRGARKDGGGRPMGLKAMLKKIETTSALQASAAARTVVGPKHYHAGTSRGDASRSASIGISSGTLTGLQDTAGALRSHLAVVKHELDSDATATSSGAESNDEAITYNNPHQQHMPIEKRALWSYQRARASIASRWTWLQAQVQELDYKIRQHNDLHKQVREAKGPVEFEGEPVGYTATLPGAELTEDDPSTETCARLRPLKRDTFRQRKLLQLHNLHIATNKAAKPTDIRCSCQYSLESCAVCTGRADPTEPAPPTSALRPHDAVARMDPAYHPVLSTPRDITGYVHMSSLVSRAWFRSRWRSRPLPSSTVTATVTSTTMAGGDNTSANTTPVTTPIKPRKYTRLKRGRPPLSRKIRDRDRDEDSSGVHERRSSARASTELRRRASYDIDNIVIPQSIAASTRPQILTYKEILTPKWRVLDLPQMSLNNGITKSGRMSIDSEEEDSSEGAIALRHQRAEVRERARYVRPRHARRQHAANAAGGDDGGDSAAGGGGGDHHHIPHVVAVVQQQPMQQVALPPQETVRPYTPRQFPLAEETYETMIRAMPDGHRLSPLHNASHDDGNDSHSNGNSNGNDNELDVDVNVDGDDDGSTMSPMSPTPFDGDDPDDEEWDPTVEKVERKKNAFR